MHGMRSKSIGWLDNNRLLDAGSGMRGMHHASCEMVALGAACDLCISDSSKCGDKSAEGRCRNEAKPLLDRRPIN